MLWEIVLQVSQVIYLAAEKTLQKKQLIMTDKGHLITQTLTQHGVMVHCDVMWRYDVTA